MTGEAGRGVDWPCVDYLPPLTCYTTPKPKTMICGGCTTAFPNGPEVREMYRRADVAARLADPDPIAEVLNVHRWKSMGVSSVQCECGEILYGDGSEPLTQFPADEAFRRHVATAALAAVREVLADD